MTPITRDAGRALDFLAGRIDYERALALPYNQRDFRLDRMRELLARLGNPQQALKIVHVAGTKGKGSTAAMVAAVLSAAGYRAGLYSSPHLDRVEERLAIDGASCPTDELNDLVAAIQPAVAAMDAQDTGDGAQRPTYFELVTALALLHFVRQRVDAAILEVGLGGRLDSTNVCQPLVSVITSISFDHTQQLGKTLAAIAGEKAGIIKPGVPVVSGVVSEEPREVIAEVARQNSAPLVELARDFVYTYRPPRHLERAEAPALVDYVDRSDASASLGNLELPLVGEHQAANAAVALATVEVLKQNGFNLPEAAVRRGLAQVRWPARVEVVRRRPCVVLDTAHNVASAEALVRSLEESFTVKRKLLVFAVTRDKDLRGMLAVLLPRFDEVIFTRYWSNPRGVELEELESLAGEVGPGVPRQSAADAATAWRIAAGRAGPEDLVCITGSFFTAAEMRAAME